MEPRKLPDTRKKILFIAAQAGQASYLNPLWEKWLEKTPENIDFKIWASPDAQKVMDSRIADLSFVWNQNDALKEYKPDLIFSSACGETQEIEASNYARRQTCKHIQLIDTFYGYKNRIEASNPDEYRPDEIWLIHDIALNESIAEGLEPHRLKVMGHPYFEKLVKNSIKAIPPQGSVVFVGQPISQIEGLKQELGYDENDIWECMRDFKNKNPDVIKTMIYAPHPAQKARPELQNGERFLMSSENPFEAAQKMVGMYSTLMIEAYLRGQRVISLQCGLKSENKDILSREGLIPLILEEKGLKNLITQDESNKRVNFCKSFDKSLIMIEAALTSL